MPWRHRISRAFKHPEFRAGIKDQTHVALGVGAWGLVTGVAMVKSGMSLPIASLMSLLVYAGSSQLAVLPLLATQSPLWVIWLTGLCVNLRFIIFSSLWRDPFGHLPRAKRLWMMYMSTDILFVQFFKRFKTSEPSPEKGYYFWGNACTNWVVWQGATFAGIFLAQFIPLHWGLGFAGILALLGVTLSLMVDRYTYVAVVIAGVVAVLAYSLPLKLNILVAIAAAVVIGLIFESLEQVVKSRQSSS